MLKKRGKCSIAGSGPGNRMGIGKALWRGPEGARMRAGILGCYVPGIRGAEGMGRCGGQGAIMEG